MNKEEKELQEQLKDILSGYEVPSERLLNEPINLYDKVITFINQNFIGKEALREKIEKIKFEEIDNGDSGIKYPTAKKSNPDALMQYAYNEAIKNILELIKISKEV